MLLNRGYGKGVYKFEYCLFNPDEDIKYLIENHLICIHYKEELDSETLLEKYNEIINSLNDESLIWFLLTTMILSSFDIF